jgi:hypothetical protein
LWHTQQSRKNANHQPPYYGLTIGTCDSQPVGHQDTPSPMKTTCPLSNHSRKSSDVAEKDRQRTIFILRPNFASADRQYQRSTQTSHPQFAGEGKESTTKINSSVSKQYSTT